jgi:hypothetical protein
MLIVAESTNRCGLAWVEDDQVVTVSGQRSQLPLLGCVEGIREQLRAVRGVPFTSTHDVEVNPETFVTPTPIRLPAVPVKVMRRLGLVGRS